MMDWDNFVNNVGGNPHDQFSVFWLGGTDVYSSTETKTWGQCGTVG